MTDIMNIKVGDQNPDAIMFNQYYVEEYKNIVTFGSIVPKNNANNQPNFSQVNRTEWQINDGWEVEIIDENTLRINKFKIDTWGLRLVTSDIANIVNSRLRIRVEGLTYVNDNFITHTPGSDTPDGFTEAYAGTGGYNVYWYPGQFTSGKYAKGLCIQQGIAYTANENECDDSLEMGKHPWDISQPGITQDGVVVGNWSDNGYKAVTIGLFGGYQTATSWHDETNGAYKQYVISDHPIILHLDGIESPTAAIDYSSKECWDVYCGSDQDYTDLGIVLNDGTYTPYDQAIETSYSNAVGVWYHYVNTSYYHTEAQFIIGASDVNNMCFFDNKTTDISSVKDQLVITALTNNAIQDRDGKKNTELLYPLISVTSTGFAIPLAYNSTIQIAGETIHGYLWSAGEIATLQYAGETTRDKINELLAKIPNGQPLKYGDPVVENNNMYWTSTLNNVSDTGIINAVWGKPNYSTFGGTNIDGTDSQNGGGFRVRPVYQYNINTNRLYHKNRTVDNCLYKYGYINDKTIGEDTDLLVTYKTLSTTNIKDYRSSNGIYVPIVTDIMENWLSTQHISNSETMPAFSISVANTELWDYVKDWAKNQGIYCDYEPYSTGVQQFMNANIDELELKILQPYQNNTKAYQRQFANSTISKLTLTYDQDFTTLTSANTLFYGMSSLTTIINPNGHPIGSFDNSGCFEFVGRITSIPGITDWNNISDKTVQLIYNDQVIRVTTVAAIVDYCFEYCTNLETIERYVNSTDRFDKYNTIVCHGIVQTFHGCDNLVTIDPVLDAKYIRNDLADGSLQVHYAFVGGDKVEDIRIKNLNHMDWRFDGSNYENGSPMGSLPALNQESITYLFDNLKDLNLHGTVIPELDENNNVLNPYEYMECPAVDHANIYCPEQWADKITQEMIDAAAAKNWGVYIGGVLKEPTQS